MPPTTQRHPGINTSPYGVLPELPKVAPAPAVKVGLTQRPTGAQLAATNTNSPARVASLLTPRSLSPASGVRMRARRARTPSATTKLAPSPFSQATSNGKAAPAVFVARDNPRSLFIRDPLPSTEAAAGGAAASPHNGAHVSDEDAADEIEGRQLSDQELARLLPTLHKSDYYCEPSMKQLARSVDPYVVVITRLA